MKKRTFDPNKLELIKFEYFSFGIVPKLGIRETQAIKFLLLYLIDPKYKQRKQLK